MKIYFEDGTLDNMLNLYNASAFEGSNVPYIIDAKNGYTVNEIELEGLLKMEEMHSMKITVYTNSLIALSNRYCWNSELNIPELYFRNIPMGNFIRVDELTDKEIRKSHNLMQMYMHGAFNIVRL